MKFLDYVDAHNGQLVITGDLFEFWRYSPEKIIDKREKILDRLNSLDVIYIPGNHDLESFELSSNRQTHVFFQKVRKPFVKNIGDKSFKFMHGHECDPFITDNFYSFGKFVHYFSYIVDFRSDACVLASDNLSDIMYEIGERFIQIWHKATKDVNSAMHQCYCMLPDKKLNSFLRPIRTHNMLSRYYGDKVHGLYDVAIAGHTHKAGFFNDWYFNSGSWTGDNNDFLTITPDGDIQPYMWTSSGKSVNDKPIHKSSSI